MLLVPDIESPQIPIHYFFSELFTTEMAIVLFSPSFLLHRDLLETTIHKSCISSQWFTDLETTSLFKLWFFRYCV